MFLTIGIEYLICSPSCLVIAFNTSNHWLHMQAQMIIYHLAIEDMPDGIAIGYTCKLKCYISGLVNAT